MKESAREIHGKVEHAREAGNFSESLQLSEQAFLKYQQESDLFGMGDILASRSITFRLLFESSQERVFLVRAKHEALAAVEITRSSADKSNLIMPLYRLGQVQEELEELNEACQSYQEAVDTFEGNPPKEHNRPAVLYDMKARLFICEFKNGAQDSLEKAEKALSDLENDSSEVSYTKDVWSSGGHMKIAAALKESNKDKASEHLQKAKKIIDSNPDLKLRKIQWERLNASFK